MARTAPAQARRAPPPRHWRVKVRMYRQGLGDCFLLTLKGDGGQRYRILIDCGVIQGTPDAKGVMERVARSIQQETGGHIDLLVGTHEHYDHLCGFALAEPTFRGMTFGAVWLGWTEDPQDPVAKHLIEEREQALAGLQLGAARLRADGVSAPAEEVDEFLAFFGAREGVTKRSLEVVRSLVEAPRYVRPGDAPTELPGGARLYVLGPPTDLKKLKKSHPRQGEGYGVDALRLFLSDVAPALRGEASPPFGPTYAIPWQAAMQAPFFRETYLDRSEARRRLEDAWIGGLSDLALKLDSDTNNTSVVLALELADGDVLLFVADAQIGSWESWPDLTWKVGDREVTGADLLRRTKLYKVGHHGSHNATMKPNGLELMEHLAWALLPVDQEMALKKRWGRMPLPEIVAELERRTASRVVRIDAASPAAAGPALREDPLFYELYL